MNAIKNINELLDAVDVKNALLKGLESSFGSEKLDIVNEGMTFTSSLLKFILYIKDKIEKTMKIKQLLSKLINDSKIQLNSQYKLIKLTKILEVIFQNTKAFKA